MTTIAGQDGSPVPDRLLSAKEADERLGRSLDWVYENAARLPFAFRLGRNWKFNENEMAEWMKRGRG